MSINGKINDHQEQDEQSFEHLRRKLDFEGEKLNQLSSNNREVSSFFLFFSLLKITICKSFLVK